jgi:DNA-binding response OmpR family regulator
MRKPEQRIGGRLRTVPSIGEAAMAKRVLVVDDEPNIVLSLEFLMRRAGFEVQVARSGGEALKALEGEPPDLMLLDVMMPEFDGYEVCERIRARPEWRHTKIIMLTARGREAERERGLALGADAYVTKPFSTRDLVDQVKRMLEVG